MAIYEIELSDGRVFHIEVDGNTPPPEEDLMAYIENNPQVIEQPKQQANKVEPISMDDIDTSWMSVAKAGLKGFGQGIEYGVNKIASGATLGATDWIRKKLGQDVEGQYKAVENIASPISTIGTGVEIAGSFPTGGGILNASAKGVAKVAAKAAKAKELAKAVSATKGQKLASKGLNFAEKASKYGYIPATGAAEGAASGYFETDSAEGAKAGAALGGVASGAFGALGGAYRKGYDIYNRTKEIGRGMRNIAQSDKGVRIMKKAINASPEVAKTARGQVDDAYEYLNKKATESVSSAFGKTDPKGAVLQAKKGYSSFIDKNIDAQLLPNNVERYERLIKNANPENVKKAFGKKLIDPREKNKIIADRMLKVNNLGIKDLSETEKATLQQIWEDAFYETHKAADYSKIGDLKQTQLALSKLSKASRDANKTSISYPQGQSTKDSVYFGKLHKKLTDAIENSNTGLKEQNRAYAKAYAEQNAYEMGQVFSPSSAKAKGIEDLIKKYSSEEKTAFVQGLVDRATSMGELRSTAKTLSKDLRALKIIDEAKANELSKKLKGIAEAQDNLKSLDTLAKNKLQGSNTDVNWQQKTLNYIEDKLMGRKYRKAGKYLLNQERQLAEPNIIPYYNFGQQTTNALIRALSEQESK